MNVTPLTIPDVLRIEPDIFRDERGAFFESYSRKRFAEATGLDPVFVQDNHSISAKGVLRGLHYQLAPFTQGKLVRVVRGGAFDVAVDIRRSSPTFGRWVGKTLTADNRVQLWIPPGFAHGFLALEEGTEFLYKTTEFYAPEAERAILWNDRRIGIIWPIAHPLLSPRDLEGSSLGDAEVFD